MSDVIPVPSLSLAGYVTSPAEKASLLLAHFFASDYNQTALYVNKIANFQFLLQEYGARIPTLCSEVQQTLSQYLLRYYPLGVQVEVTADTTTGSEVNLNLNIIASENDGKSYQFGRLIQISDGKFKQVVDVINQGLLS